MNEVSINLNFSALVANMSKILVIDDDEELCRLLDDCLTLEGFSCSFAHSGTAGMNMLQDGGWDLLVLDVMLPGCSGYDVLRFARSGQQTAALPILMLTAKSGEMDRITGLESGADDYLTKPFSFKELCARIKAILRRVELNSKYKSSPPHSSMKTAGDLTLNSATLRIMINNEIIPVTPLEFHMLEILIDNIGQPVSREQLSQEVLGHSLNPLERTVDVHISRIRSKLGNYRDDSPRIKSIRGSGYVYLLQEDA